MVPSEYSGVMFTADPSTNATDRIVIEAAFGQGEVVVSGLVEPDTYVVAKDGPRLVSVRVGHQAMERVRGASGLDDEIQPSALLGGQLDLFVLPPGPPDDLHGLVPDPDTHQSRAVLG